MFTKIRMKSTYLLGITVRKMFDRNDGLDNCKLRLIAISDNTVYDLLRNVTKTTYCVNVECQTDECTIYAVIE